MSDPMLTALMPPHATPAMTAVVADPGSLQQPVDPHAARHFAGLMTPPDQAGTPAGVGPGTWPDALQAIGRDLGSTRSLQDLRSSMLASVDLRDPIGTMFALTDHSLEAHAMFARLHISSGLASAATNLFGTLLKNQQ